MRSISGFNSGSLDGSFAAGQPVSASALNKLAGSVDKCRPMMSNDIQFLAGTGGVAMGNPQQVYEQEGGAGETLYQQYQLEVANIETSPGVFAQKLKLAKGTVNFTQSNMPRVRQGGHSDQRQAWLYRSPVLGTGVTAVQGEDTSSIWMEANGYYNLASAGTYYVTISKFDINQSNDDTESALLNAEVPFVSIFPAGDDIESTIFSETGPSEYVNKTNIHKMTGYDADSTGLSGDWGNCHTTWFNPVKWGYAVKLIGIVTVVAGEGGALNITIDQHILGPIDLQIPCLFNGTTLCNQDDLNEANDPYNLNKNTTPQAWADIINSNTLSDFEEIVPVTEEWFQEFIGPADWSSLNYSYLIPASCAAQDDGEDCLPFKVKSLKYLTPEGQQPYAVYNICPGTINNLMPLIYDDVSENWVYMDEIPQPQIALAAGTETWIVLRAGPGEPNAGQTGSFPANTPGSPPENDPYPRIYTLDTEPPDDTDNLAYVVLAKVTKLPDDKFAVNQFVTGSLWGDRIKLGTQTATYYYARI
jgi:hypothetical protein